MDIDVKVDNVMMLTSMLTVTAPSMSTLTSTSVFTPTVIDVDIDIDMDSGIPVVRKCAALVCQAFSNPGASVPVSECSKAFHTQLMHSNSDEMMLSANVHAGMSANVDIGADVAVDNDVKFIV